MIDAYASQPHYAAHIAPIWWALPPERRGCFYLGGRLAERADSGQVYPFPVRAVGEPRRGDQLTIVASFFDEIIRRPLVYVEHGAGQTYEGDGIARFDPSYNGAGGHDKVRLFLCPNETVAARWRSRYQDTPVAVVGCPRLDRWHPPKGGRRPGPRVVAVTFHHHSQACPETHSAWLHYEAGMAAAVAALKGRGWRVLGHWHPRLGERGGGSFGRLWAQAGAEPVADPDEVFARADVLCGDNTSLLPEFASIGGPVVFLNCPDYRRDVKHGGRFWSWPEGQVSCDDASGLPDAVDEAWRDPLPARLGRERMVDDVYCAIDGKAALRAVEAIERVL